MNSIDKIFKNELNPHRELPSPYVWTKIESALDKQQVHKYKHSFIWMFRATGLLFFLLISTLLYDVYFQKGAFHKSKIVLLNEQLSGKVANNLSGIEKGQNLLENDDRRDKASELLFLSPNQQSLKNYRNASIVLAHSNTSIKPLYEKEMPPISFTTPSFFIRYSSSFPPLGINVMDAYPLTDIFLHSAKHKRSLPSLRRFAITALFSPDISRSRLNQIYDFDHDDINDYRKREHTDLSYTMGILVNYPIKNRWSLESGLMISNYYSSIQPMTVKAIKSETGNYDFTMSSSFGFIKVPSASIQNPGQNDSIQVSKTSSLHLQYLTIPLSINYTIPLSKKVNLNFSSGFAAGIITRGQVEITAPGSTIGSEETQINKIVGLRKCFFSALLGTGIEYNLNSHFALSVSPRLRMAITAINKNTPVKSYPGVITLESGLTFRF